MFYFCSLYGSVRLAPATVPACVLWFQPIVCSPGLSTCTGYTGTHMTGASTAHIRSLAKAHSGDSDPLFPSPEHVAALAGYANGEATPILRGRGRGGAAAGGGWAAAAPCAGLRSGIRLTEEATQAVVSQVFPRG